MRNVLGGVALAVMPLSIAMSVTVFVAFDDAIAQSPAAPSHNGGPRRAAQARRPKTSLAGDSVVVTGTVTIPPALKDGVVELRESWPAAEACSNAIAKGLRAEADLLEKGIDPSTVDKERDPELWAQLHKKPPACIEATVAVLTAGTHVAILSDAKDCAPRFVRLKVTSGKSDGKVGCLADKLIIHDNQASR